MFVTIDISQTTGFSLRCEVDWGMTIFNRTGSMESSYCTLESIE